MQCTHVTFGEEFVRIMFVYKLKAGIFTIDRLRFVSLIEFRQKLSLRLIEYFKNNNIE